MLRVIVTIQYSRASAYNFLFQIRRIIDLRGLSNTYSIILYTYMYKINIYTYMYKIHIHMIEEQFLLLCEEGELF